MPKGAVTFDVDSREGIEGAASRASASYIQMRDKHFEDAMGRFGYRADISTLEQLSRLRLAGMAHYPGKTELYIEGELAAVVTEPEMTGPDPGSNILKCTYKYWVYPEYKYRQDGGIKLGEDND